ncbi:precorrin-6y C5,15-methyltransferase (decarboxylating) subunit CbiE [Desulfobaculum bizertense]|uniref:precorrin-6y C5,15-methyltransferase (decarboxylating) subunit CbiE n=1 Tax=Desulfobaculum bizertense TaxID=376490 RepID=UPI001F37E9FE|nr:precorrin-6y C5,15-methyltransferase (decarboxylating) subunit CbiE [Desulfobaculum bizertense]UIJ37438.1 precorrin-6y C5,15-methyltransferase (decarboxylating) subunit CbiE [Desulfobaculum bizertense]
MNSIHLVGLGQNPASLSSEAQDIVHHAQVLCSGKLLLDDLYSEHPAEKIAITAPLEKVYEQLEDALHQNKTVVVLADGDPLFYSIGAPLIERFGPDMVQIYPGISSLQRAAAQLRIPWQGIPCVSLHGRDDYSPLFSRLRNEKYVAVLTDKHNIPSAIAHRIAEKCPDMHEMWVLEDLGGPQENVSHHSLEQASQTSFHAKNIVIIEKVKEPEIQLTVGTPDESFVHEKGLITKSPIRAAGLGALQLRPGQVMWDLGAGCGSVGLEASLLLGAGRVYAIEKNARRIPMIRDNIRRMGAFSVELTHGTAPDGLDELPDPDRIFMGGGLGGDNGELMDCVTSRLRPGGRLVIHTILLDSLHQGRKYCEELGWECSITMMQASESSPLAGDLRLAGLNPVFIFSAQKPHSR